ncbi:MAG: WG repeat-containing protein, partial [Kofleriaceae bacterium]
TDARSSWKSNAWSKRGSFYGYLSASGEVIADGFEDAGALVEERAAICQRARWGYIDRTGAIVIRPRFARVLGFSEGLAAVRSAGAWGFIDATGAQVIAPSLGTCGSFHEGRARVTG